MSGIKLQNIDTILTTVNNIIKEFGLSKTNKEGFEKLRLEYNMGKNNWIYLYTLMCFSFNNQYRFNNLHQYNSSFGKHKSIFSNVTKDKLINSKECLDNIDISFMSKNFKEFDFTDFDENDFIYVDPPYLNSTGNYNDGKRGFEGWNFEYEKELRNLLIKLNNQNIRWALSNNFATNETLNAWCSDNKFIIHYLNNTYSNSSYQKIDRINKDIEVLITNY